MDISSITDWTQLGGQVVIVVLFIRYLTRRDKEWIDSTKDNAASNITLAKALQRLTDTIISNNASIEENIPTVSENTEAVEANTEAIEKNGNTKPGK